MRVLDVLGTLCQFNNIIFIFGDPALSHAFLSPALVSTLVTLCRLLRPSAD